jgi:hypothetical protein
MKTTKTTTPEPTEEEILDAYNQSEDWFKNHTDDIPDMILPLHVRQSKGHKEAQKGEDE